MVNQLKSALIISHIRCSKSNSTTAATINVYIAIRYDDDYDNGYDDNNNDDDDVNMKG